MVIPHLSGRQQLFAKAAFLAISTAIIWAQMRYISMNDIAAAHSELDEIEAKFSGMQFALEFSDRVYTLRQHVDYVRKQLHSESQNPLTENTNP